VDTWVEPIVEWRTGVDSIERHAQLIREGELLVTWPAAPFEQTATDCFKVGSAYWIWQPGVGGIRFFADQAAFAAFPSTEIDRAWFEHLISRSWLPTVYQVWGRQVLHASAVARPSGDVVAFTGPSGAGKSTLSYGLGKRRTWTPLTDDTLAFSCEQTTETRTIRLHPLKNDARLRTATAAYYGKPSAVEETLDWPELPSLRWRAVYAVEGDPSLDVPASFSRLKASEAYTLLLEQAHALTLKVASHNRRLMRDYLEIAATLPVFRMRYRKSFDAMEDILDAIDRHVEHVIA
jgi:hypothetical protein